jgi:hypothetical protein
MWRVGGASRRTFSHKIAISPYFGATDSITEVVKKHSLRDDLPDK